MEGRLPADLAAAVARGGEMGARFAAFDWASHPLGPPSGWDPEIRAAVAVALASRFPTILWLGHDLWVVYNDGYIPMLSEKHPAALGAAGRHVWAEIWDVVGPMLDSVVATGVATWSDDLPLRMINEGRRRERYFTFTYSPMWAANGDVHGVFCAVVETTERVLGERRLQALNVLAGAVIDAQTPEETVRAAVKACAEHPADMPFVAAYLRDPRTGETRLETATPNVESLLAALAPSGSFWSGGSPVIEAAGLLVDGLEERLARLRAVFGDDCPQRALVLPLADAGAEAGWLVVGLSRYHPLDEQYRAFCRLLADQVAAAVSNARAYEAERRRAEALAELDAAKTAFFTNVSHEFRTPLTLLIGPARNLLDDVDDPLSDGQRHQVGVIARNAERLLGLVNTLLDFSRLQSGAVSGRFQPTDLAAETRWLATMFSSAVEQAGLGLDVDVDDVGEAVFVDREMWARIVMNLLSNALKFTFEGGITVQLHRRGDQAELSVLDTGVGIAASELPRLFERFHRVAGSRSRSYEGSGIGLALVAELAALHGGTVGVDSAPGEGSRFWVRVPLGSGHLPQDRIAGGEPVSSEWSPAQAILAETFRWLEQEPPPGPVPEEVGPRESGQPARPRVLVVDDNADMRDYVTGLLAPEYRVSVAVDGADALAVAREDPPDLVLTDVMMPNLDGFGLLAALRQDPATTGVPVVFLSARAGPEGIVEGLDAGADDYVAKPFVPAELLARVRANLELDRSRRTRAALERSRELLDQAQRLARLGSWEIDVETGQMIASDECLRLVQMDAAELEDLGLAGSLERNVHPDDRERVAAILDRALEDRQPFVYEVRLVHRDGSAHLARIHGEVVVDDQGRPLKLRGSLQDIEEQRRSELRLAAAAAAEQAAARERAIADELQSALLPAADVSPADLDVSTFYRAGVEGTHVGGDWYDVIDLGAGRVALVLGDVMGRGVRAAALMGQLRSAVRAYARLGLRPAEVLESLDGVVRDLDPDQIVTCVYAIYDAAEGSLVFANAGHLPPLLAHVGPRTVPLTGAAGPPLGVGPLSLAEQHQRLPSGALVALYTDGLVERRGQDLEIGLHLLAGRLSGVPAHGHLDAAIQDIVETLLPDDPDDDVALLLARVPDVTVAYPEARMAVPVDRAAVSAARRFACSTLEAWNVSGDTMDDAVLAISELVTNAMLHGRPPIELRLRCTAAELVVEVSDGYPAPPRRLRPTLDDEHGRGLMLVAAVAERWGTRPGADAKWVWCTFPLDRSAAGSGGGGR